jgi:hypothetical protein
MVHLHPEAKRRFPAINKELFVLETKDVMKVFLCAKEQSDGLLDFSCIPVNDAFLKQGRTTINHQRDKCTDNTAIEIMSDNEQETESSSLAMIVNLQTNT